MLNRNKLKNVDSRKREAEKVVENQRKETKTITVENKENNDSASAMKKEFLKRLYSRDRSKSKEKENHASSAQRETKRP